MRPQAPKRLIERSLALAASISRLRGGACVTSESTRLARDAEGVVDGAREGLLVFMRGVGEPAQLAHELFAGRADLPVSPRGGRCEVEQRLDVPAHADEASMAVRGNRVRLAAARAATAPSRRCRGRGGPGPSAASAVSRARGGTGRPGRRETGVRGPSPEEARASRGLQRLLGSRRTPVATSVRRISMALDVSGPGFCDCDRSTISREQAAPRRAGSPSRRPGKRRWIVLLSRQLERDVARRLGDAEVGGINDGERHERRGVNGGVPLAGRPPHAPHDRVGKEHAFKLDVVRAGAPHAERPPGIEDLHARRVERQAEVDHRRSVLGIVEDAGGHEQLARRDAAAEESSGRSSCIRPRPSRAGPIRPASPSPRS